MDIFGTSNRRAGLQQLKAGAATNQTKKNPLIVNPLNVGRTMAEPKGSHNYIYPQDFQHYKVCGVITEPVQDKNGVTRPALLVKMIYNSDAHNGGANFQLDATASLADLEHFTYKDAKGQIHHGHPQTDLAAQLLQSYYKNHVDIKQQEKPDRHYTPINHEADHPTKAVVIGMSAGNRLSISMPTASV